MHFFFRSSSLIPWNGRKNPPGWFEFNQYFNMSYNNIGKASSRGQNKTYVIVVPLCFRKGGRWKSPGLFGAHFHCTETNRVQLGWKRNVHYVSYTFKDHNFFYLLKLCIHCYSILLTPNIRQTNARLKNISHKTNGVMKSALNSYLRTSVVNKDSSGCEQVWRWAVAPLGTRVPRLQSPSVAGNW